MFSLTRTVLYLSIPAFDQLSEQLNVAEAGDSQLLYNKQRERKLHDGEFAHSPRKSHPGRSGNFLRILCLIVGTEELSTHCHEYKFDIAHTIIVSYEVRRYHEKKVRDLLPLLS